MDGFLCASGCCHVGVVWLLLHLFYQFGFACVRLSLHSPNLFGLDGVTCVPHVAAILLQTFEKHLGKDAFDALKTHSLSSVSIGWSKPEIAARLIDGQRHVQSKRHQQCSRPMFSKGWGVDKETGPQTFSAKNAVCSHIGVDILSVWPENILVRASNVAKAQASTNIFSGHTLRMSTPM